MFLSLASSNIHVEENAKELNSLLKRCDTQNTVHAERAVYPHTPIWVFFCIFLCLNKYTQNYVKIAVLVSIFETADYVLSELKQLRKK